jgi:uncharacterized membrane-anchored protein YjiN (DUF445 family)
LGRRHRFNAISTRPSLGPALQVSAIEGRARSRLRLMRLAATGLLVAMAGVYVLTGLWVKGAPWLAYVRAFAEAGTVGACADWFAVTALFRRPFGLPIPHTGIIPRNRERIGEALGAFIADNFLTTEVLSERLRQLEVGRWGASWLRQPANAAAVAARLVKLGPELLAFSTPEARRRFVSAIAADAIAAAPAAKLASAVLRAVGSGERGEALLDAGLDLLTRALANNADLLRAEVAGRTFRWLPRWLDEKIADRILGAFAETLEAMRASDHPWRGRVLGQLQGFAERLETEPELVAQAEAIKAQIVAHPVLLARLGELGEAVERRLTPRSDAEVQALAAQLATWLAGFGDWLYGQTDAIEIFNDWARLAVERAIAPRRHDIGRLIASVVAGWDVRIVVDKLELQVGADLQYIRINGTLVGGSVGLIIFTLSEWFGARG